ncbi:MAG: hypothetical protein IPL61_25915 [Myxococcales bacterium]|nr:hypothetical protein [Myxococcales bacterium]
MHRFISLALVVTLGCDSSGGDDTTDPIRACTEIDATGITSATIDQLVARYQGQACVEPLAGGISGLLQECQYGTSLTVCGGSSGLSQFGCSCSGGHLTCSNGEAIKEAQERLCDAGVN